MLKAWEAMRLGKDAQITGDLLLVLMLVLMLEHEYLRPVCMSRGTQGARCHIFIPLRHHHWLTCVLLCAGAGLLERCKRHEEDAAEKARTVEALRRKVSSVGRSADFSSSGSGAMGGGTHSRRDKAHPPPVRRSCMALFGGTGAGAGAPAADALADAPPAPAAASVSASLSALPLSRESSRGSSLHGPAQAPHSSRPPLPRGHTSAASQASGSTSTAV